MAPWGVGISPDSLVYVGAADSITAGKGVRTIASHYTPLTAAGAPLTIFPPAYPLLLSMSARLTRDRLASAKWLHAFIYGATVFVIGMLAYVGTGGSIAAALASILLFQTSARVFDVFTMAWSDSPFMLLCLLAVLLLIWHIARPTVWLLLAAAAAASAVTLTRYVGVVILPPMVLTILLLKTAPLKHRIRDSLILGVVASLPLALWFVRNLLVANSATERALSFHLISKADILVMMNSLALFWVPFPGSLVFKIVLLAIAGGFLLYVTIIALATRKWKQQERDISLAMIVLSASFAVSYVVFMLTYNTFVSPQADLDVRDLCPFFVFLNVLAVTAVYRAAAVRRMLWIGFLAVLVPWATLNASDTISRVAERRANGVRFSSREWTSSATVNYLRSSPADWVVYSNGIDLINFLTGRDALRIPAKADPVKGSLNLRFDQEIESVRDEVRQHRAIVVYFDNVDWRWYLPTRSELEDRYQFPVMTELPDGVIYGVK